MTTRLISPNRRRIVTDGAYTVNTLMQLRALGWADYAGPATATSGLTRTTAGWVVPGTDPVVDKARFVATGIGALGLNEPVKP